MGLERKRDSASRWPRVEMRWSSAWGVAAAGDETLMVDGGGGGGVWGLLFRHELN